MANTSRSPGGHDPEITRPLSARALSARAPSPSPVPSPVPSPSAAPSPSPSSAARAAQDDTEPTAANDRLALNGMGSFDWDLDKGTYHLDDVGLEVFDLRADEFDGQPASLSARVLPADSERLDEAVALALREGHLTFASYFRLVCRDGTLRWAHTQGRVLRDRQARPYRIVGIVRNAEEELAHAEGMRTLAADRRRQTDSVRATTEALARAMTVRDVTDVLTDSEGLRRFGADGLALGLVDGDVMRLVAATEQPSAELRARDDLSLTHLADGLPLSEAVLTRRARFIGTREELTSRYPRLLPYAEEMGIEAAAFLPLAAQARSLGALGLFYRDRHHFSTEDRNICIALSSAVAQSLQRAMLFDQEREFATTLQTTMLPRRIPEISGGEVAVRYRAGRSGREVGGDWYDVIPLPGRRVGLVVGDVEGHDSHAAAIMGQLRIALRAYATEGHTPATVMARASGFLAELDTERSATCLYVDADLETGTLRLVRAGHLEPLVRHGTGLTGGVGVRGGLPLGVATVFGQDGYPETRLDLNPGDTLLLCTDGLVEHPGRDITDGIDALAAAMRAGPQDTEALADHLCGGRPGRLGSGDDVALLLLHRAAVTGVRTTRQMTQHVHQADPEGLTEARAMLRQALAGWGATELLSDVELTADELITNALVHTDGGALLTVELRAGTTPCIRLEIRDRSSVLPRRRTPGETATSGRGLLLVDALTGSWGVEPLGSGKNVWCEFPLAA